MIVIFIDNIDDFLKFLDRRIMNELFYEFKESRINGSDQSSIEIILHFLGKAEGSLILYETKQKINKNSKNDGDLNVLELLKSSISKVDPSITLLKGKIREIFLSYS